LRAGYQPLAPRALDAGNVADSAISSRSLINAMACAAVFASTSATLAAHGRP
jgi:hypothetical protein